MTLAPPAAADTGTSTATELADELGRLIRVMAAMKASTGTHTADGSDKAALALLFPLLANGPLRSSALAELVYADPSTVSRHVGELLRRDLVRREADPVDGRASLLAVTEAGRAAVAAACRRRDAVLDAVLGHWSHDDRVSLTRMLARLTDSLDAALPTLPARLASLDFTTLAPEGTPA